MNEFFRWVVGLIVLPFSFVCIFFGVNTVLHLMFEYVSDFIYILEGFVSVFLIIIYFIEQYADEKGQNNQS